MPAIFFIASKQINKGDSYFAIQKIPVKHLIVNEQILQILIIALR